MMLKVGRVEKGVDEKFGAVNYACRSWRREAEVVEFSRERECVLQRHEDERFSLKPRLVVVKGRESQVGTPSE